MHATGGSSRFFALRHHFLAVNRKRLYNLCISREISPLRAPPTRSPPRGEASEKPDIPPSKRQRILHDVRQSLPELPVEPGASRKMHVLSHVELLAGRR